MLHLVLDNLMTPRQVRSLSLPHATTVIPKHAWPSCMRLVTSLHERGNVSGVQLLPCMRLVLYLISSMAWYS